MKTPKATLPQSVQILSLFADKDLSVEQTQTVLESGLVTDILESVYGGKLDISRRDSIRELLGLEMLHRNVITAHMVDINFATLSEGIVAGGYDWADSNITADLFPIKPVKGNERKREVFVVHFNFNREVKSSEEVIVELDKLGFCPAVTEELLALGKDQPELQRQYPIIALGSSAVAGGGRRGVPCLGKCGSRRLLYLFYFALDWLARYRFLAVRKFK